MKFLRRKRFLVPVGLLARQAISEETLEGLRRDHADDPSVAIQLK